MLRKTLSIIDELHQELVTLRAYWKETENPEQRLCRVRSLLVLDLKYWAGQKYLLGFSKNFFASPRAGMRLTDTLSSRRLSTILN